MKIERKIAIIFIAITYLVVTGSSMLCASASVYFVNKNAKPFYTSQSSSKQESKTVWIINRHIVSSAKTSVTTHLATENLPLFLSKESFVIIAEQAIDFYKSEYFSDNKGRAPPLV